MKYREKIDSFLAWTLVIIMSLMVINVLWQVFSRFILGDPSSYTEELARYLMIWVGVWEQLMFLEKINMLQLIIFPQNFLKLIKNINVDIISLHGQTIYHNSQERISNQLGDGKLLSQLTKKNIVYDFRQNDIENGGEGAPLAPIFHQLLATQHKLDLPTCILNIGGISNITIIGEKTDTLSLSSRDIGPGNCLIDSWVRKNSDQNYDKDGILAAAGTRNEIHDTTTNRPDGK